MDLELTRYMVREIKCNLNKKAVFDELLIINGIILMTKDPATINTWFNTMKPDDWLCCVLKYGLRIKKHNQFTIIDNLLKQYISR